MSGTFTELDLDNLGTPSKEAPEIDFEIVDQAQPQQPPQKAVREVEEDDEEEASGEGAEGQDTPRKKLSRSARLKLQRDSYAAELAELRKEAATSRAELERERKRNAEAAEAGYDFYEKTLTDGMAALRAEFDAAFDAGDKAKVFDVQQRMSELAAEKAQVVRDRRARPTKAAEPGQEAPQQTQQTQPQGGQEQAQPPRGRPNPLATSWFEENKTWFNKDPVMTQVARVIDHQITQDGFDPNEPEYFEELDKRLRSELPHKFGQQAQAQAAAPRRQQATVQNRATSPGSGGKVKVSISQEDRDVARRLGVDIMDYARQKARREIAERSVSGYVEIE